MITCHFGGNIAEGHGSHPLVRLMQRVQVADVDLTPGAEPAVALFSAPADTVADECGTQANDGPEHSRQHWDPCHVAKFRDRRRARYVPVRVDDHGRVRSLTGRASRRCRSAVP